MNKKNSPPQLLTPYRQRKHEAMVQAILEAARAIMQEQGVAALSIQELARRMDLRAPSLYNYFASKMDIYDALFRLGFILFHEHMQGYSQKVDSWRSFVLAGFEGYLTFAKENPDLYQLCFERPVPGFVPSQESLELSFTQLQQTYERVKDFEEDIHSSLSPQQKVDLIISMIHGITALHMANEPELPVGQGRFGSLIPAALAVLESAWSKR